MAYSNNGEFEQLVEQITDVIYARLNGERSDQAAMCGCTSECFHRCPERMHRVVDAGAARIGLVLGQTASARDWASLIDHTLLKPDATESEIKRLCEEAAQYHFASVCVNPTWVRVSACNLQGSGVPVCTVIGFPLGATLPDVKAYEARRAGVNDAMHSFRAAMKTFGRAATHRRLIDAFAVQTRIDHVGDLLNQLFEISVL